MVKLFVSDVFKYVGTCTLNWISFLNLYLLYFLAEGSIHLLVYKSLANDVHVPRHKHEPLDVHFLLRWDKERKQFFFLLLFAPQSARWGAECFLCSSSSCWRRSSTFSLLSLWLFILQLLDFQERGLLLASSQTRSELCRTVSTPGSPAGGPPRLWKWAWFRPDRCFRSPCSTVGLSVSSSPICLKHCCLITDCAACFSTWKCYKERVWSHRQEIRQCEEHVGDLSLIMRFVIKRSFHVPLTTRETQHLCFSFNRL